MNPHTRKNLAWRGWVDADGEVIAWPTLLADHNDYLARLGDGQFLARWRQWSPGDEPDFDPGASPENVTAVRAFLGLD